MILLLSPPNRELRQQPNCQKKLDPRTKRGAGPGIPPKPQVQLEARQPNRQLPGKVAGAAAKTPALGTGDTSGDVPNEDNGAASHEGSVAPVESAAAGRGSRTKGGPSAVDVAAAAATSSLSATRESAVTGDEASSRG